MKIVKELNGYRIYRPRKWGNDEAFCFFVDHDKSSWSSHPWRGVAFKTKRKAQEFLKEIRRREQLRRKERKAFFAIDRNTKVR